MPYWENLDNLVGYKTISQDQLLQNTNVIFSTYEELTLNQRKVIQEKYGTISLILPHLSDEHKRNSTIEICSQHFHLSKPTIRNRLCSYLIYQDIRIFF